jgi:hypothetical protein
MAPQPHPDARGSDPLLAPVRNRAGAGIPAASRRPLGAFPNNPWWGVHPPPLDVAPHTLDAAGAVAEGAGGAGAAVGAPDVVARPDAAGLGRAQVCGTEKQGGVRVYFLE